MIKLKPCPFCGGEAEIINICRLNQYKVECGNYRCLIHPTAFGYSTKKEAIDAWNTRADDAYSDDGK